MESAGTFLLNLKITKHEIEALTAGLSIAAHFLPFLKNPLILCGIRDNAWYMVSYNHKFENLGIHRLSRIISASISIEDYVLSAWHVISGFEKIPIKVHITEPNCSKKEVRRRNYINC